MLLVYQLYGLLLHGIFPLEGNDFFTDTRKIFFSTAKIMLRITFVKNNLCIFY